MNPRCRKLTPRCIALNPVTSPPKLFTRSNPLSCGEFLEAQLPGTFGKVRHEYVLELCTATPFISQCVHKSVRWKGLIQQEVVSLRYVSIAQGSSPTTTRLGHIFYVMCCQSSFVARILWHRMLQQHARTRLRRNSSKVQKKQSLLRHAVLAELQWRREQDFFITFTLSKYRHAYSLNIFLFLTYRVPL